MPIDFLIKINIHIMRSDTFLTCVNAVNSWGGGENAGNGNLRICLKPA